MEKLIQFITSVPVPLRILGFGLVAVLSHFTVRGIRELGEWILTLRIRKEIPVQETFSRKYPKTATLLTILVSSITFAIYFVAIGFILKEFKVSLKTYLASASVIGLAIGFGTQGFVQDVISGLTLIFSDALNIEDVVEISGQIGRVEKIGLRFTTTINIRGQRVFLPNRNISVISRFRRGVIRAYVDIQMPEKVEEEVMTKEVKNIADAMHIKSHPPAQRLRLPRGTGLDAGAAQPTVIRVDYRPAVVQADDSVQTGSQTSSVISGQLVSRFGRYRFLMLCGTAMFLLGVFLLSRMTIGVSYRSVTLAETGNRKSAPTAEESPGDASPV